MADVPNLTVVEAWASGWALSRGTPAPVGTGYGLHIEVGLPRERSRHILPLVRMDALRELAGTIGTPWTFIKACAHSEVVRSCLPAGWTVQAPNFMMTRSIVSGVVPPACPSGYRASISGPLMKLLAVEIRCGEEIAARGRVALHGRFGVFDQIVTEEAHRRRGLGSLVMSLLSREAARLGAEEGVLVATEDGRKLYTALGWDLQCPLTSTVIEDNNL